MSRTILTAVAILILTPAAVAWGHGHPIHLTVADNRLTVSMGVPDTVGFAPQIFVEQDSAGDPEDFGNFAGFGDAVYWLVPGLEIIGLAENSGLHLEALARPINGGEPDEQRLLWYWDPVDEAVELAPDTRLQIRRSATVNILLTPNTVIAPPPIQIAAPVAAEMNRHNHDLIRYLLPFPLPASGAYGFFARLTSNVYQPSDPFLVMINNGGLDGGQMLDASLAINAAAIESLPGDFNKDGNVDAADYTVWRNESLGPEKYLEWKSHFGQSAGNPGGAGQSAAVPEPGASALMSICAAFWPICRQRIRRFPHSEPVRQIFA